ncbi:MAG: nucleotidyl transferase AbiEii/AbiGii toxin family protein [Mongoliitalea sp.]
MQARDFYDIWFLLEVHEMNADLYLAEFEAKCKSKKKITPIFRKNWRSDCHNTKGGGEAR